MLRSEMSSWSRVACSRYSRESTLSGASTPCRAEEFGRRSAHDRAEIMDQVRLVSKAAGACDIRPAKAALPRSDDLFDPRQSRILFRAGPECCAEAARQVALADIQERGEFSYAQARI